MKNNIRSMSIKVISLISSVMVLFTCLIIPAAATDVDSTSAYQPTFENLLDFATEYEFQAYRNGNLISSKIILDPVGRVGAAGFNLHFIWGSEDLRVYYDYILIGLQIPSPPTALYLNDIECVLLNTSDGISYYKCTYNQASSAYFDLEIDLGSSFGEIRIVSCYGVVDTSIPIYNAHLKTYGQWYTSSNATYERREHFNQDITLPYTYDKPFVDTPTEKPLQFFVDIGFSVPVPYADSVSITLFTNNIWPNYYDQASLTYGGFTLYRNGSTQESLPYIISDSVTSSFYEGYPMYFYTLTVDLSGIDLTDSVINFRSYLGEIERTTTQTHVFYHMEIVSISYRQDTYFKPWYMRMFYWIQDEFMKLRSHLDRNFNNVIVVIQDAFGIGQDTDPTPDQEQEKEDSSDDLEQSQDDLQDIIDGLDEAPTVPDYGDTGLDEFTDQVDTSIVPVRPVFVIIFDNPMVLQYVTYVFMFALGGFLLFGER